MPSRRDTHRQDRPSPSEPREAPSADRESPAAEGLSIAPLSAGACPFLVAAGGAWRMSVPDRDHRCSAFAPATSLAPAKQARLCLTAAHAGCATFVASTSARQARIGGEGLQDRAGRWGISRTTPVIEEVGGLRATLGALIADRRTWPAIPAVLLATLALALGLSGTWGEGPVTAIASPILSTGPSGGATLMTPATEAPSAVPSAAPSAPATTTPTVAPSATPAPAVVTYRVRSGDTLSRIASQFHTTSAAIARLNGITVTTVLHIGQVLKIPSS